MSDQKQDTEMKPETGTWEGHYLDAYGYRGKLELQVDTKEDELSGSYKLLIRKSDRPQIIKGPVTGAYNGGEVRIQLSLGKAKESVEFKARLMKARSYASQCMYGVLHTPPQSELGGGVWIAWHYTRKVGSLKGGCNG